MIFHSYFDITTGYPSKKLVHDWWITGLPPDLGRCGDAAGEGIHLRRAPATAAAAQGFSRRGEPSWSLWIRQSQRKRKEWIKPIGPYRTHGASIYILYIYIYGKYWWYITYYTSIYIYTNIKGVYWWDPWSTINIAAPAGSVMGKIRYWRYWRSKIRTSTTSQFLGLVIWKDGQNWWNHTPGTSTGNSTGSSTEFRRNGGAVGQFWDGSMGWWEMTNFETTNISIYGFVWKCCVPLN